MKKIVLAVLALFICNSMMAQWKVGLSVGYDMNHYDYDHQWAYGLQYKDRGGLVAEIPVSFSFNDWFQITTGVAYVEKGFVFDPLTESIEFERDLSAESFIERNDYHLTLPLGAEFSFGGNKWRGFVSLGGYVSFWMASCFDGYATSIVRSVEPFHQNMRLDPMVYNRFEAGLFGGLGVSYQFNEHWACTVGAKYYHALTDQHKDYQRLRFPSYNRTLSLQVGLMYNFK